MFNCKQILRNEYFIILRHILVKTKRLWVTKRITANMIQQILEKMNYLMD